MTVGFEEPLGTLPAVTEFVPVFTPVAVTELNVFVFGEASGADPERSPATNLKISDTSVCDVKLLKYDP